MFDFLKISEGTKEIAKHMIENPHDWYQTDYYFVNRSKPNIKFWTANGISFLQLVGNEGFSLIERIYLNKAIKKSIANRLKQNEIVS